MCPKRYASFTFFVLARHWFYGVDFPSACHGFSLCLSWFLYFPSACHGFSIFPLPVMHFRFSICLSWVFYFPCACHGFSPPDKRMDAHARETHAQFIEHARGAKTVTSTWEIKNP
jgi:hypothetical protein